MDYWHFDSPKAPCMRICSAFDNTLSKCWSRRSSVLALVTWTNVRAYKKNNFWRRTSRVFSISDVKIAAAVGFVLGFPRTSPLDSPNHRKGNTRRFVLQATGAIFRTGSPGPEKWRVFRVSGPKHFAVVAVAILHSPLFNALLLWV